MIQELLVFEFVIHWIFLQTWKALCFSLSIQIFNSQLLTG